MNTTTNISAGLSHQVALVTGANRGIGRAVAKRLAAAHFHVIVAARELAKAQQVVGEISAAGGSAEALALNLADDAAVASAGAAVVARHTQLHVLVNNAGQNVNMLHNILQATPEDISSSLQTNAMGPLALVKALLPALQAAGAGRGARVVNVSSSLGSISETTKPDSIYGYYDSASYRLSKTALNGITGMLAKTLRDQGIKVNAMCPGWTATDMGGPDAPNSPEQAAELALRLATLPADGPTGGFFNEAGVVAW
jgi:NAD(P)-dependent dehydrogenase (short-subunit alcohol dehydrogenase family)